MGYRRGRFATVLLGALLFGTTIPAAAESLPVQSLPIIATAAPGLTKDGPFTAEPTKQVAFGTYVTWRFATDPILAWQDLTIEVATKGPNGAWSPFRAVATVVIDDTGVAFYAMRSSSPRLVSVRAVFPAVDVPAASQETGLEGRSRGVQARWMASPPRPVPLTGGSAVGASTTFTSSIKLARLGQTVTWQWAAPGALAEQSATVWIAERAPSGLWGPYAPSGSVQFDAHGTATYRVRFATSAWIAIRIHLPAGSPPVPETWSVPLEARWR